MSISNDHTVASASSEDDDELSSSDLHVLNTDFVTQQYLTDRSPFQNTHGGRLEKSARDYRLPPRKDSADQTRTYAADDTSCNYAPSQPPINRHRLKAQVHRYNQNEHQIYLPQHIDQRPRPLVEYIKNEWRHVASDPAFPEDSECHVPFCLQICMAPKIQRSFLILAALVCLAWGNWKTWAGPRWNESVALDWSLQEKQNAEGVGWFGSNMRPQFFEMVHMSILDPRLLPSKDRGNRLIVVGDVHGCHDELSSLLTTIQYASENDHLIFVGNLIGEGPSSTAVADLAISQGASCVRGNYEDRVLLAQRAFAEFASGEFGDDQELRSPRQGLSTDRLLARQLTDQHVQYLSSCPVILSLENVTGIGVVHVVHAGLVAGVPLANQDPVGVMSMRTVDLQTHVPSSGADGVTWWKVWNQWQAMLREDQRSTVIYGHESTSGSNIRDWSKGIDSGCWMGGSLTAFVIHTSNISGTSEVVKVDCKDYRIK